MMLADPQLPPMFTGHAVKAPDRAFAFACAGAAAGRLSAADFVWARNTATVECALVLEPDVARERAQQMAVVMEVAIAEALGAVCPPQVAVEFRWPGEILVNGGIAGRIQVAAPSACRASEAAPSWLVVSMALDLKHPDHKREPGEIAHRTSLFEEGAGEADRNAVIEALAPRLLAWIHTWTEDGFRPIHDQWLFRAEGRTSPVCVDGVSGFVLGRDESAGLVFKPEAGRVRIVPFDPHVVWLNEGASG